MGDESDYDRGRGVFVIRKAFPNKFCFKFTYCNVLLYKQLGIISGMAQNLLSLYLISDLLTDECMHSKSVEK